MRRSGAENQLAGPSLQEDAHIHAGSAFASPSRPFASPHQAKPLAQVPLPPEREGGIAAGRRRQRGVPDLVVAYRYVYQETRGRDAAPSLHPGSGMETVVLPRPEEQ